MRPLHEKIFYDFMSNFDIRRKRGRDGDDLDTPPRTGGGSRLNPTAANGGDSKKRKDNDGFSAVLGANLDTSALTQPSKSPKKSPHSGPALGANLNFDTLAMGGMTPGGMGGMAGMGGMTPGGMNMMGMGMGKGKGKGGTDPMMAMMMAMMAGKGMANAGATPKGKGKGFNGGKGVGFNLGSGVALGAPIADATPQDGTPKMLGVPNLTLGANAPIAIPQGQGMEPDHLGNTDENLDIKDSDCGRVIGQKGQMLNKIKTATKCQIMVKPREHRDVPRRCIISGGQLDDRLKGMRMVLELVEWANHPGTGLLVKNGGQYLCPGVFNSKPISTDDFDMYPEHTYNYGNAPDRILTEDMEEHWPKSLKPCGHNQAPRDGFWPEKEGGQKDTEAPTDAQKGSARYGGPNGTFIVTLWIRAAEIEVIQNNVYSVMKVTGAVIDVDRHENEEMRFVRVFAPKVMCVERAKHLILKSIKYAESDGIVIKTDKQNDTPASGISGDGSMTFGGTPSFADQFQLALGAANPAAMGASPAQMQGQMNNMMAMGMGLPGMPDMSQLSSEQMMQMQQNFIRQQQLQHQAAQGADSSSSDSDSSSESGSDSGSDDEDLVKEKAQKEQGETPQGRPNFSSAAPDIDFDDI